MSSPKPPFNLKKASDTEASIFLFGADVPPKGLEYVIPQIRETLTFPKYRKNLTTDDETRVLTALRIILRNQELVNNEHAGVRHSLMITIDALCDTLSVLIKSKQA